jgi:hypothetical protein
MGFSPGEILAGAVGSQHTLRREIMQLTKRIFRLNNAQCRWIDKCARHRAINRLRVEIEAESIVCRQNRGWNR